MYGDNPVFGFYANKVIWFDLFWFVLELAIKAWMSRIIIKHVYAISNQQRRRSACAFAQSDQHLCSLPRLHNIYLSRSWLVWVLPSSKPLRTGFLMTRLGLQSGGAVDTGLQGTIPQLHQICISIKKDCMHAPVFFFVQNLIFFSWNATTLILSLILSAFACQYFLSWQDDWIFMILYL